MSQNCASVTDYWQWQTKTLNGTATNISKGITTVVQPGTKY